MRVFFVLISDVSSDHLLIESNRGHKVTSGPKILTCEIPGLPGKSSCYRNRTLPFNIDNRIRYRLFWQNADANMHVIRHQMPFHNLAFLLCRQLAQYPAKMLTDRSKYHLLSSLRDKYHVIFAIPFRMTKTLVLFHLIIY